MKMSKTVKQIVALGTGVTMMGATLLGAMATADLANYPAPFVKDGKFSGILVVGDKAAAEDVIGVSDIAMSLQYAATKKVKVSTSATTSVEGDAFKISKSGDPLNFAEQLSNIASTATKSDLNALADGTVTNSHGTYTYSQYITMPNDAKIVYAVDENDQSDDPAAYLKFAQGSTVYVYKMSFGTALKSDIDASKDFDDLDNKKISLLGKPFTIIDTDNTTGMIKMMGGAVEDTMEEGQTKTYSINNVDYEVTVNVITDSSPYKTKMTINGEVTEALEAGETYKLKDGTELGIKEILPNEAGDITADIVSIYLGANSVELTDSNFASGGYDGTISISGTDLSNAFCKITGSYSGTTATISAIEVNYTADDNYYVPVGGKLSDIISDKDDLFLNNIEYEFATLNLGTTEVIKLSPSASDKYKLKMPTKTSGDLSLSVFYSNSSADVILGSDDTHQIVTTASAAIGEKDMFITSSGKYSHLVELTSMDSATASDPKVTLTDKGSDGSQQKYSATNGTSKTIYYDGYALSFIPNYNAQTIAIATYGSDANCLTQGACLYTPKEARVDLITGAFNLSGNSLKEGKLVVTEDEDGHADDTTAVIYNINTTVYDTTASTQKITLMAPVSADVGYSLTSWDSKDDYKTAYTLWGTFVEQDTSGDQDTVTITYPSEEGKADVYLTSGVTTTTTEGAATGDTVTIEKIDVGATKLASEVLDSVTDQNVILVGGPCANPAVEAASTAFETCSGWSLASGEGVIQVADMSTGNVAMLVAGTDKLDTRKVTQIVADYDTYKSKLTGKKVKVSTANMAITAMEVAAATTTTTP